LSRICWLEYSCMAFRRCFYRHLAQQWLCLIGKKFALREAEISQKRSYFIPVRLIIIHHHQWHCGCDILKTSQMIDTNCMRWKEYVRNMRFCKSNFKLKMKAFEIKIYKIILVYLRLLHWMWNWHMDWNIKKYSKNIEFECVQNCNSWNILNAHGI
jgi:hypothetical protein